MNMKTIITLCALYLVGSLRGADPDEAKMAERMNKISAAVHKIYLIQDMKERKVFLDAFDAAIATHQELRALQTAGPAAQAKPEDPFKAQVKAEPATVPAQTLAAIRARAVKEWPGEYNMQEHTIKNLCASYITLQQMRRGVPGVPPAVLAKIFADASKHWGDEYNMVEYDVKRETEAYRRLHP